MQRPCTCDRIKQDGIYTLDQCRICWLYHFNPRYRRLWGGEELPRPGLLQKAGSFLKSASTYLARGMPQVSEEEYQRRSEICLSNTCGFFREGSCLKCGCRLLGQVAAKARWATEHCPINLW
jgi:hypothetical protein